MSKRRRRSPQPTTTSTRQPQPPPERLTLPLSALVDPPPAPSPATPPLDQWHRLATSASGSSGSGGNFDEVLGLLDEAAALLAFRPVVSDEPARLRAAGREYQVLTERAIELERAAAELRAVEQQAAVVRRRLHRARRSAERAAEREERRESGGLYASEPRTANRPIHVEVDPQAWEILKAEAIRRRQAMASVVGQLVTEAVDQPIVGQRSGQPGPSPAPTRRFARLFVGDDVWRAFRVTVAGADLSAARAVGLLVEREARGLGWVPAPAE